MSDFEKLGVFYLGRSREGGAPLLYDSKDLVTHAVCVGMTGSGKTGLCLSLLEEAAIDGIPALVIDPKGDLSNLLLAFEGLSAEEFAPWVNEDDAKRKGLTVEAYAASEAERWKKGLASWGQDGARIGRLKQAAEFAIYTPGSTAGRPVSILSSFGAPSEEVAEDREQMRERISGTATAVLGLAGIEADPIQSREHILLSTILDAAWKEGKDLDLGALVQQIQTPPVSRIGVLDVEAFYPSKERFQLAVALNNLMAAPGFEAWLEGEALDAGKLLYTAEGKPRVAIFSIAHLSDAERMFFVTLVLQQTLGWMRRQAGTSSLRALLYMDEIFGYFPPVANPPSKTPLLTLLKQARAFGLGVVLATQNPVDLDYKGLANAGTWFIGRLQTDRDKQRLLDGLVGAGGRFERGEVEKLLAGLESRVFLMNNVHDDGPVLFETRWALSYLRGPLTRAQIKQLTGGQRAEGAAATPAEAAAKREGGAKPVIPPGIEERFVPVRGSVEGVVYAPFVMGAAAVQFVDAKKGVDVSREVVVVAPVKDGAVAVVWEESEEAGIELDELETAPADGAGFAELPGAAMQAKNYRAWSKDFAHWVYSSQTVELYRSASTGETSAAGESEKEFRLRNQQGAREKRDAAVEGLRQKYAARVKGIEDKIFKAKQAVEREQAQASAQKMESMMNIGMSVLGAVLGGGRRRGLGGLVSGARSAGRSYQQNQDVGRAEESVERLEAQLAGMQQEIEAQAQQIQAGGDAMTEELERIPVRPKKTNIRVKWVGLVWKGEGE